MLKLALPNKGVLSDEAVVLLREAGYGCMRTGRELMMIDQTEQIEFYFLRPRDIALYVGGGVLDLGITGRDLALDGNVDVAEILPLEFGKSRFCYAVPNASDLTPDEFGGLRIATSYPEIVRQDMKRRKVDCSIVRLDGAVEISIRLGVADAIADVVESGRTLTEAGLKIVGEPVMRSEALLIARSTEVGQSPEVLKLVAHLRGVLLARSYAMIEYDIPRSVLGAACELTPGIESPTIAPLSNPDWVAVKAMIRRKEVNQVMDELYSLGARGIIITDIRTCRL